MDEYIKKKFHPATRSVWFLFFGLALGPAIIFFERDPEGSPLKWILLSFLCLGIILHRASIRYTLSTRRLRSESWWGLGRREEVTLASLRQVRPAQGFSGRLVGCGHLEVTSEAIDEPGMMLLGQPRHLELAKEINDLAKAAKAGAKD